MPFKVSLWPKVFPFDFHITNNKSAASTFGTSCTSTKGKRHPVHFIQKKKSKHGVVAFFTCAPLAIEVAHTKQSVILDIYPATPKGKQYNNSSYPIFWSYNRVPRGCSSEAHYQLPLANLELPGNSGPRKAAIFIRIRVLIVICFFINWGLDDDGSAVDFWESPQKRERKLKKN